MSDKILIPNWGDPPYPGIPALPMHNGKPQKSVMDVEHFEGVFQKHRWHSKTTCVVDPSYRQHGNVVRKLWKREGVDEDWVPMPKEFETSFEFSKIINMITPDEVSRDVAPIVIEGLDFVALVEEARERGSEAAARIVSTKTTLTPYERLKLGKDLRNRFVRRWWRKYRLVHFCEQQRAIIDDELRAYNERREAGIRPKELMIGDVEAEYLDNFLKRWEAAQSPISSMDDTPLPAPLAPSYSTSSE